MSEETFLFMAEVLIPSPLLIKQGILNIIMLPHWDLCQSFRSKKHAS